MEDKKRSDNIENLKNTGKKSKGIIIDYSASNYRRGSTSNGYEYYTNYTVVGNPSIDSNFILTGTDTSNYLDFSGDILDLNESYDVIIKFKITDPTVYTGILGMGNTLSSFSLQDSRMKRLADRIKTILNS